jgi:Det1 complexing ubiquitin ligase
VSVTVTSSALLLPTAPYVSFARLLLTYSFFFCSLCGVQKKIREPAPYLTTSDTSPPQEQVLTTDNTNLLLRYAYQQFEAKQREKEHKVPVCTTLFAWPGEAGVVLVVACGC